MDIASETDKNEMKELAKKLEMVCLSEEDTSALSFVMGNPKNPLLLSPVIQCLLKFLNFEEMKNFRLVCREWGSTGKYSLARRALIYFDDHKKSSGIRRPAEFQSRFLESAALFSAFKISGNFTTKKYASNPWTIEELEKFFHKQQKYIKELTINFEFSAKKIVKKIDLGSWLSESPMVKKDTKHMTKLSIKGDGKMLDIPLHLIMHIKDLSLSNCRISLETGIKICPIKLNLSAVTFYRNGINVVRVLLNDIMDFSKAKGVSLFCKETEESLPDAVEDVTLYCVDLQGDVNLETLFLSGGKTVNGERSRWVIGKMGMGATPYALNSQMKIKELSFNVAYNRIIDFSTLPATIEKLVLSEVPGRTTLTCIQPLILENLHYLEILNAFCVANFSFLSHFISCPQLTCLSFYGCDEIEMEMNTLWMPKSLKILSLENSLIKWSGDSNWNLGTLLIDWSFAKDHCKANIKVDDVVMIWDKTLGKFLVDFLEDQKRLNFGKRLFIGQLKWGEKKLEDTVLKGHVDAKSSFYVFQNGEKGRALSKEAFHDLVDIPKDIYDKFTIVD